MFIQVKPDIEDEDISGRSNWNRFIIDESIEVPIFLNKYKNDILHCGKTINFFKKFKPKPKHTQHTMYINLNSVTQKKNKLI